MKARHCIPIDGGSRIRAVAGSVAAVSERKDIHALEQSKSGGGGPWGGGGGGKGGGPGGRAERGPGGPQGSPPDLEDIIRRGQDKLKRALPGGGGVERLLVRPDRRWSGRLLGCIKAIYTVQPDELAVELRFGKPKEELSQPGLHFHWWPIETVETVKIAEKLVNIGEVPRQRRPPA